MNTKQIKETIKRLDHDRRASIAPLNFEGKQLPKAKSAYQLELERRLRKGK